MKTPRAWRPAGGIISNIDEMSHWLIALMNDGKYNGKQVLPPNVLKATLQPAIGLPNTAGRERWDIGKSLNAAYGMGRETASYRGQLLTFHGGDLPGFHSQVSFMPNDQIGVIVFVIGDHSRAAVQHHQLQRVRAAARHGSDAVEPALSATCGWPIRKAGHRSARQRRERTAFRTPSPRTRWRITSGTMKIRLTAS